MKAPRGLAIGARCLYLAGVCFQMTVAEGEEPPRPSASQTTVTTGRAYAGDWRPNLRQTTPLYEIKLVAERGPGLDRLRATNTDEQGRVFYEQLVVYENDVPKSYTLTDRASNLSGTLAATGAELLLTLSRGGKTKRAEKKQPPLFAVGPSIARLLERRIGELRASHAVELAIVAVTKLQIYDLKVVREDLGDDEPIPQVRSGAWLRLRMEPANALFRIFAPRISLIIGAQSGILECVVGPIPLPAAGAGNIAGIVCYDDPQRS